MRPDVAVMLSGFVLNAVLLVMLLWKRAYRVLPVFMAYMAYSFCSVLAGLLLYNDSRSYVVLWSVTVAIDTLFYLGTLIELGKSVLRHNRVPSFPGALVLVLFAIVSAPIWVLTRWPSPPRLVLAWQINLRVMQATSILEVGGVLTIVWLSTLQDLDWPERELRLVMGMAAWPMVQICVLILHEHGLMSVSDHWLDLLTPIAVSGAFLYWLHYFWIDPTVWADCRLEAAGQNPVFEEPDASRNVLSGTIFPQRERLRRALEILSK